MKKNNQKQLKPITVDGMLTIEKDKKEQRYMDFQSYNEYDAEEFKGKFQVDGKHDGNIYMREITKRVKNTPIFRDDNCSFSRGKDGKYYFYFQMPEEQLGELPGQLVRQASTIAQKVIKGILANSMED